MNAPTEQWLRDLVAKSTGAPAPGAVTRLAGHASSRSYWRVVTGRANRAVCRGSVVVMVLPPDAPSDEISKGGMPLGLVPFVEIQRYLARIGVRVPELIAWSQGEGYAVLEDLGDTMLVTAANGAARTAAYRDAVDQLARMRVRADAAPDPDCVAFRRRYDVDLYTRELGHFLDYGLGAAKGIALPGSEHETVTQQFLATATQLAGEHPGFTHRDYQARNVMVLTGGEQAVIDFQDALLGPRVYDLVSLLRDSYVELDPRLIEDLIRRYLAATVALGGPRLAEAEFRRVFDLVTVQRKLKDAGRFVYLDRVKGNPDFLRFVPVALRYVREAFARLPELRDTQRILGQYIPELRTDF
ncbi:MAG TPA: phosphotransferase [Actinomycetota bacterium]|nr:phosphotransferase [Actinomycetota bacterium]